MKNYTDIDILERYAKALTIILVIVALLTVVTVAVNEQSSLLGIASGVFAFILGYLGICIMRVFAGIARDIRDIRNERR